MKNLLPFAMVLLSTSLPALSVDEAIRQAQESNLGLATEALRVDQKADERTFSFNRLYPSVTASTTLARLDTLSFNLPEDNHWNLALGINVQLLWSPAVFRGMAQTLIDYENASLSRAAAVARLERDVRKAFYQLLALNEATAVLEAQLKVAENRWKLAKLNFEAGLGSEMALLQAQVAYENRKPAVADQKWNEENARASFRILLNLPSGAPLDLEGTLEVNPLVTATVKTLNAPTLIRDHLEGRSDLGLARVAVRSLENLAALQADSLLPNLVLGYTADPTANAPFAPETWKADKPWTQRSGALSMGVVWKVDGLLPGSTSSLEIAGRRRQAEQARLGVEQTRRAAEAEIASLVGRAKKSATSLEGLSLALGLAQRSARLTEAGYQVGNQSFNDAQDADLQWQSARLQYLNEELSLTSTLADLDYALASDRRQWLLGEVRG